MNDLHTPRPTWNPLAAFGVALGFFVAAFLAARALPEVGDGVATGHLPSG
jgi:hypothetical protein